MAEKRIKKWIELARAVLPVFVFLVVIAEHVGAIDRLRGLDKVQQVAYRFSLSYAPDASRPVYPDDAEWKPTIALIKKYSHVKWQADKQPQTIARKVASLSTNDADGNEWTSPSTPIFVLYRHWPAHSGVGIPRDDWTIVGSIGDLKGWIERSRSECHFFISDVLLALVAMVLSQWLWHVNYMQGRGGQPSDSAPINDT